MHMSIVHTRTMYMPRQDTIGCGGHNWTKQSKEPQTECLKGQDTPATERSPAHTLEDAKTEKKKSTIAIALANNTYYGYRLPVKWRLLKDH